MAESPKCRVLVIEDAPSCLALFRRYFLRSPYKALFAANASVGLTYARERDPDVILMDLNLPGMNGFDLYKLLQSEPATRGIQVVFITGVFDPQNLLESACLGLGATAFLRKPFSVPELDQCIEKAFRATRRTVDSRQASTASISRGRIRVDTDTRQVWVDGKPIADIGPRRFSLLCALLRHDVLSRADILCKVWEKSVDGNVVNKTIQRLRQDLGRRGDHSIVTLRGGYRLVG